MSIPDHFNGRRYYAYNDWVKREHGGRLQKISIDAGFSCPNRDGQVGTGGCTFCNNEGFTPAYLRDTRDISAQIEKGLAFVRRRYPEARRFMAYFQAYSNTYADLDTLKSRYEQALSHPDITGLVVGTRPDCLTEECLDYLAKIARQVPVELEIGIESCSDEVLLACRRGHDFACTQQAILQAAERGLFVTGHLLLGLPKETRASLLDGAKALAKLPLSAMKFHQLQLVQGTSLAQQWQDDPKSLVLHDPDSYMRQLVEILEYLPSSLLIQRLGSDVPPRLRVSPDWGLRLSDFSHRLEQSLADNATWQSRLCQA